MTKRYHKVANRKYIEDYKRNHPCAICGESHIAVLDFHHRDRSSRNRTVSQLASSDASLGEVKAEVLKCDVLCCNCHRRLHYEEDREVER